MKTLPSLYPMTFQPVFKDYIWGGRNLADLLGRKIPSGRIAESWDIAAHPNGTALVANGRFANQPLTAVQQALGLDLIGSRNAWALERNKFPLLIKLLDAHNKLSVQVHPNDSYALTNEGNELGKTEMWVVLHAEPDAAIILGVTPGTTAQNFRQAIVDGNLAPHLHHIPVKAGDVVCVPAGSLHAILNGTLIAEIQQNSDTTYRVYDWNRVQDDGTKRPLHIEKALDVINFGQVAPTLNQPLLLEEKEGISRSQLCRNRYFVTEQVQMAAGSVFNGRCDGSTLEIWGVIDGEVDVNEVGLTAVQFTLLPAALGSFSVTAQDKATLLRVYTA